MANLLDILGGGAVGFLTGGPAGAALGAFGAISSGKQQKKADQANRQVEQFARNQQHLYDITSPGYQDTLNFFRQYAGLPGGAGYYPQGYSPGVGAPVYGQAMGNAPGLNQGKDFALWGSRKNLPGVTVTRDAGTPMPQSYDPDQLPGIWNNPTDRLRLAAAEEQIGRFAAQNARNLEHALGQRGVATGSQDAIQRENQMDALRQFSGFRRDLALEADREQERRMLQYLNTLGIGLQGGQNAAGIYSSMAANAQNQANQIQQGIGQTIGGLNANRILQRYAGPAPGSTPGINPNPGGGFAPIDPGMDPFAGIPGYQPHDPNAYTQRF